MIFYWIDYWIKDNVQKILVIDDDVDLLKVTKILLERTDFIVNTLSVPKEIDEKVVSFKPDLIILDVNLPDADGRIICKEFKSNPLLKSIPIILFSADENLVNSYKECFADAFIMKPFDINEFINTIKEIVNKKI